MNLWMLCNGETHQKKLVAEPWRVVEAQHISSSRDLVDTLEQHDLLEELIEESKPPISKGNHYLIFSPFRYPPLRYGSRFGSLYEPSLWYGSLEIETAFAEVAYYRLQFFMDCEGELDYIETPVTAFTANLSTNKGIDLTNPPFSLYQDKISNTSTYEYSQPLGSQMRDASIDAFIYFSARVKQGKNIGVYVPDVFKQKKNQYIDNQQNWLCIARKDLIEFTRVTILNRERLVFPLDFY
jgi:hypothetical protein